jgi:hypothetical protein
VWDRKESWRGSTVMRSRDGDKVIIKRDDGRYMYFPTKSKTANSEVQMNISSSLVACATLGRLPRAR